MKAKLGVSALFILFLAGLWLIAAPFAIGYQPRGAAYAASTINDMWVGGALAGLSFAALVVYAADALRDVVSRGRHASTV